MRSFLPIAILLFTACSGGGGGTEDTGTDTVDTATDTATDTGTPTTDTGTTSTDPTTTDTFAFGHASVDVLFVIDNSASMADDQATMATTTAHFLDFLLGSSVDYRVGVTTTDPGGVDCPNSGSPAAGELVTLGGLSWLDASVANPDMFLGTSVQVGTAGCFLESGLTTAYQALTDTTSGFRRDDAALVVVFVSDEDDQSTSLTAPPIDDPGMLAWLDGIAADVPLSVHGVLCLDTGAGCTSDRYRDVIDHVGGVSFPLDDAAAWEAAMVQVGIDASGTTDRLLLTQTPDEATLVVGTVLADGSETTTTDWTYDAATNEVVLQQYVDADESWYVRYEPL